VFAELLEAPPQEGARFVVRRHAEDAEYVEVDDEGVVLDIDRPEDYQALQKRSDLLNAAGGKPPRELS
jgi:CTP:molybdopterin cytidylyltransferase MocA